MIDRVKLAANGVIPNLICHVLYRRDPGGTCIVIYNVKPTVRGDSQINQFLHPSRISEITWLHRDHLTTCVLHHPHRLLRSLDIEIAPDDLTAFNREA